MNRLFLIFALAAAFAPCSGYGQEDKSVTGSASLVEAVEQLRSKTIPEAYFSLSSPKLLASPIFAPDTKGGAYVVLIKDVAIPKHTSAETVQKEIDQAWAQSKNYLRRPVVDTKNNRIPYYSEDEWRRLSTTMKPFVAKKAEIEAVFPADDKDVTFIVLRIPAGEEEAFVKTFVHDGLGFEWPDFPYTVGWN